MFNKHTIAHVYAKAIFDIAIQYNNINQWGSMLDLFSKISQDVLIQSLCFDTVNKKKLLEILIVLFEDVNKKKLDLFGRNFVFIVVKNKRVLLFPIIFEKYNNLYDNYIQSVTIEVISARKLSDSQLKKITEIMTHRLSKKIKLVCYINESILAGIVIKIKDTIIDGSLIGRVSRLHNFLQF